MICKTDISTRRRLRLVAAFTMVEIVLSLAVIAVAMVAIIGVLPLGMNVQSENRETSIVNTDAGIWIEAIRSGAQGMEYLTNFVLEVRVDEIRRKADGNIDTSTDYYTEFTSASNLIGILSYPKYRTQTEVDNSVSLIERFVYADVRAMNGNMGDMIADNDFAFKYRLTPELVEKVPYTGGPVQATLRTNLHDLRMNFAWPLVVGADGYRQQSSFSKNLTFRTMVSGNQAVFNNPADVTRPFHFVNPRQYGSQTK